MRRSIARSWRAMSLSRESSSEPSAVRELFTAFSVAASTATYSRVSLRFLSRVEIIVSTPCSLLASCFTCLRCFERESSRLRRALRCAWSSASVLAAKAGTHASRNATKACGSLVKRIFPGQEPAHGTETEISGNHGHTDDHADEDPARAREVARRDGNARADLAEKERQQKRSARASEEALHRAFEHEGAFDEKRTSARIFHILHEKFSGEQRKLHRISDDERERHEQKETHRHRPEHKAEFPGGNFIHKIRRSLHFIVGVLTLQGVQQAMELRRGAVVIPERKPERRRKRVTVHEGQHIAREVHTEIFHRHFRAHISHGIDLLEFQEMRAETFQGITLHGSLQKHFHGIQGLFHGKQAERAQESHKTGGKQERTQEQRHERRQDDRPVLPEAAERFSD